MESNQQKLIFAYKSFFNTESGSLILADLSERCFENKSTFVENGRDKQNVNQGKRSIILYIRAMLSKDPLKPETKIEEQTNYI